MLETRAGLIQAALGKLPPELKIRNIRLVNVYSGEILEGQEIAVWRGRIAFVGPNAPQAGPETTQVDGRGMYLVPGFIDAHGHADLIINPVALAGEILPTGTTAMLSDTHDMCGALGPGGLDLMLEATRDIPFRYYLTAPAVAPPLPEFEGEELFSLESVQAALGKNRVLAISEVTAWNRLLQGDKGLLAKLVSATELGKRIEGHMSGCSYEKVNALTACGFTSCHESITAEEALQKLRLGLHVMLRHGSIRADLEPLSRLITENPALDTSRVMLTPDWASPHDVLKYGYLDHLVATAVRYGIPPVKAIQMVTVNPATYLGLSGSIGGIAPGRHADMLLVEDLANPKPSMVFVGGKLVAKDGKLQAAMPGFPRVPVSAWRPERKPGLPVTSEDFELEVEDPAVEYPCVQMVNKTITKLVKVLLPVKGDKVDLSGSTELLKFSLWSFPQGKWLTGILSGFGARPGGLASSMAHENHYPMVVGVSDKDMAIAANRMLELGGGMVLVQDSKIVAEIPMASGGLLSDRSVAEVAEGWNRLNRLLQEAGCPWDDPLFGLGFLTFTGLPYVRFTPKGIVDIRKKELVNP